MDDKVDVLLVVPEIDKSYNLLLPVNKKIGTIISLISKGVKELSDDSFPSLVTNRLYNSDTMQQYDLNTLLINTDIRNGTKLVLITDDID